MSRYEQQNRFDLMDMTLMGYHDVKSISASSGGYLTYISSLPFAPDPFTPFTPIAKVRKQDNLLDGITKDIVDMI